MLVLGGMTADARITNRTELEPPLPHNQAARVRLDNFRTRRQSRKQRWHYICFSCTTDIAMHIRNRDLPDPAEMWETLPELMFDNATTHLGRSTQL